MFDKDNFCEYMFVEFPTVFNTPFTREWLANMVEYARQIYENNEQGTVYAIWCMLPDEVKIDKVWQFWY